MRLMCRMPLAASPHGLGMPPTTTMRSPLRSMASSTLTYSNGMSPTMDESRTMATVGLDKDGTDLDTGESGPAGTILAVMIQRIAIVVHSGFTDSGVTIALDVFRTANA